MRRLKHTRSAGPVLQRNRLSVRPGSRKTLQCVRGQRGTAAQSGVRLPFEQVAHMEQPTLKVDIKENLLRRLEARAEQSWPGHGVIGRDRLTRDALRRYMRYCNGRDGTGNKG